MARNSGVEWAGPSFNPWLGCSKISPGCKHCYAEMDTPVRVHRARGLELWGAGAARHVTASAYWREPLAWDRAAAAAGAPLRVFCGPDCDVFEASAGLRLVGDVGGDARPWRTLDDVRAALWALVDETPHLIWMLTTKRIENVRRMVPAFWLGASRHEDCPVCEGQGGADCCQGSGAVVVEGGWPRNVWILCTVEDAERAAERLPVLAELPASVRGVSYEPALSAVDWGPWLARRRCYDWDMPGVMVAKGCGWEGAPVLGDMCPRCNLPTRPAPAFNWLIAGGESGPNARPAHPGWIAAAHDAAKAAGVPFFFKQWGEWLPITDAYQSHEGAPQGRVWYGREGDPDDLPLLTYRVGKKRAGRLLDDAEHSEVPTWPSK